ncbi:hypothetical protein G6F46_015291 [Rhizopus delemar]|nr:hypothetical protein G6F46_015291 [Rhizopus delemar]
MWLTTGLGQLSRYARAVTAGEPVPPPRRRRDEIGDLGQALETMRRKLEGKAYVEQSRYPRPTACISRAASSTSRNG